MTENQHDLIDFDDFGLDDIAIPEYADLSDLAQPVPSPPQTSLLSIQPPLSPVQPGGGPLSPLQAPQTSFLPPLSPQNSAPAQEISPLQCGPGQDLHCSGFITTPTASSEVCNPQNSHQFDVSADSSFMADDSLGLNAWERLLYLIENLNFSNDGITDEKMREYNKRISVYGHLVLPLSTEQHQLEAEYHDNHGTLPADRVHSVRVVRMTPEQRRQFEAPDTLPTAPPNPQAASLPAWVYPNEGQSTLISVVDIMDLVQHLLTYTITMQEAYDIENRIDSAGYVIEFEEHQHPFEITDAGSRAAFSVRRIFEDDSIPPPLFDSREIDRLQIVTQGQGQGQGQGQRQDTKNQKYKSWSPYETVWRPSDYCSRSLGGVSEENSADVNAFLQDSNLNSTRASPSPPSASLNNTNNNNLVLVALPPGSPGSVPSPQAASFAAPPQNGMQNSCLAPPLIGPTEHGPAQISPTHYYPPPPRPGPRNLTEVLIEGQQYTSNPNNSDIHISFLESPDTGNIAHAQNQNMNHTLGASQVENVARPSPLPDRFMQRSPSQFRPETRTFAQVLQYGQNYVAQHNASSDGSSIFASPQVENRTPRQSPGSILISPSVKAEVINKISDILDKTNLTDEEAEVIDADLSIIDCKLLPDLSQYEFLSFEDALRLYGSEDMMPAGWLIGLINDGDTFEEGEIEGYNRVFARTGHGLRLDPLARTAAELEMEVRLMNRDTVPWRCRLVHTGNRRIFQREPPSQPQGQGQGQGQGQSQGMSPRIPALTRQSYPVYERNPGALISATPPRRPQVRVDLELREPLQPLPTFFGNQANQDSFKSSPNQSPNQSQNHSHQYQQHLEPQSGSPLSPQNFNNSNNSNSTSNSSANDVDYWSAFLDLIQDLNFNNQSLTSYQINEYNNIAAIYGHFIGPMSRELYDVQNALQENLEPYERRYTCRVFRMKAAQRAEHNVENTAPVPPPPDFQLPPWVYEFHNPGMDEIMELVVYLFQFTITMQEAHDLEHRLNSIGFEIGFDERPDHIPSPDVARNFRAGFHVLRIHEGDPVRPPLFDSLEQRRLNIVARDVVPGMDLHPKALTVKKGLKPRNWQNSLGVVNEENRAELEGYLRNPSAGLNSNPIPLPPISGPIMTQQQQQNANVCASPANANFVAPPPPPPLASPMLPCPGPQQFMPTSDGPVSPLSSNPSPVAVPPRRCSRTSMTQGTKGGRSSYGTRDASQAQASSGRDKEHPFGVSQASRSKSRISQNRRGSHTFHAGAGAGGSGAMDLSGRPGTEMSLQNPSPSPEQLNGMQRYINCSRSNGTNGKAGGVTCAIARRSPISNSLSQQQEPQSDPLHPQSQTCSPLFQNSNLDNNSGSPGHQADNSMFGSPLLHSLPQPQLRQPWVERSATQQQSENLPLGSNVDQNNRTTTMVTSPCKHIQSVTVKAPPGILCASAKTAANYSSPEIGEQQNVSLRINQQPPVYENPQLQIGNNSKMGNENQLDPLLQSTPGPGGSKNSTMMPPSDQGTVDVNNLNYNCGCSQGNLCTCDTCQFKPN